MKKSIIILIFFCANFSLILAQGTEWHVRPYADNYINPPLSNGRSFETAWCLQFALTGAGGAIQPGDTVWLHGVQKSSYTGTTSALVYKGHFTCNINNLNSNPEITFASYPGEWAIIDGNIRNSPSGPISTANLNPNYFSWPNTLESANGRHNILTVTSNNVHFHDFEVTCLGNFSRVHETRKIAPGENQPFCEEFHDYNFYEYGGINHTVGVNRFTNLVVRNIPGIAISSWKNTANSEIYGNILYNNGVLEVIGTSCFPVLQTVVNSGLTLTNSKGHQASVYTQNADSILKRKIRNNIFLNCYDSGLIIWSANDLPNSLDYVRNYSVDKNIFLNNGSPVRDETSNMLVSTYYNPIYDIDIDSNIFYINSTTNFVSGIKITNANNVNITNNCIINGTAGMQFEGENNHGIKFNNNIYFGKRMQVFTSINNFNGTTNPTFEPWYFHHNNYYKKYLGTDLPNMYLTNSAGSMTLATFQNNFTTLNDLTPSEELSHEYDFFNSHPSSKYFITQNKENSNLFYVTIYNPAQTNSSSVNFSSYDIPNNRIFKIRDVQNYFTQITLAGENTMPSNSTLVLPMNLTNFEMPLPQPHDTSSTSVFGPTYVTAPYHTISDISTFAIEFDCGLEYDRLVTGSTNLETSYVLRNNITFENYTSNTTATDVTARASRQILIKPNSHIKNNTRFLGRIEVTCAEIPYNIALADAAFDMDGGLNRGSNAEETNTITKSKEAFTIYPNPSSGIFTVESLSNQKISKIIIYQMDGPKIIMEKEYKYQSAVSVDISNEKIGWYSIHLFLDDKEMQPKTIFKE